MSRDITVIGRGLIGRELRAADTGLPGKDGLAWHDHLVLERQLQSIFERLDVRARPQALVWTAGRAVIASSEEDCQKETEGFRLFLNALSFSRDPKKYLVVFSSSLGGLFAGSLAGTILNERTEVQPASAYGREKVNQENLLRETCSRTGVRASLARIATAYGPGQDERKAQGLVMGLITATRTGRPVRVFVPLDTRRSFLWAGDVAQILEWLATRDHLEPGAVEVRVVAGDRPVSVVELISIIRRVTGRRPPVLVVRSSERLLHAAHLDARTHWKLPVRLVPIEVGVARCWASVASGTVA